MLTIRLSRTGKKNDPSFRLLVTEKTNPVKGKFLEELGFYNPRRKTKSFKKERILYWIGQGVGCSATVHNLLVKEKIIQGPKVKAWRPKKRKGEEKVTKLAEAQAGEKKEEKSEEKENAVEKAEEAKSEEKKEETDQK
jgi:small subunit ribosomal protein S16